MIIGVDPFSKWAEAEAVQSITTQKAVSFVSKSIFIRFVIPKIIIIDNETEFASLRFKEFCRKWDIDLWFSSAQLP